MRWTLIAAVVALTYQEVHLAVSLQSPQQCLDHTAMSQVALILLMEQILTILAAVIRIGF